MELSVFIRKIPCVMQLLHVSGCIFKAFCGTLGTIACESTRQYRAGSLLRNHCETAGLFFDKESNVIGSLRVMIGIDLLAILRKSLDRETLYTKGLMTFVQIRKFYDIY